MLSTKAINRFVSTIYDYYADNKRSFSWRETSDPYKIVLSEIMLQQTQTDRVKEKYEQFVAAFPTLSILARVSFSDVLVMWQGLGYNRRALAIHQFAQQIVAHYGGIIPDDPTILCTFKGIGPSTASSICAFAYNKPTVFIETNIRTVYLQCFFLGKTGITDKELMPLVAQTLDKANPRQWYYALMDYGVMLKKKYKNPSRRSAHYTSQSKFEGSNRQVRGLIIKMLVRTPVLALQDFTQQIQRDEDTVARMLHDLVQEGLIEEKIGRQGRLYHHLYHLAKK